MIGLMFFCAICTGIFAESGRPAEDLPAGSAWLIDAKASLLTPETDRVAPVAVSRTEGVVESAEAMLAEDGRSAKLTYAPGGPKPVAVLRPLPAMWVIWRISVQYLQLLKTSMASWIFWLTTPRPIRILAISSIPTWQPMTKPLM